MNYFQETLLGTKLLDKILKKLKRYWQNIDQLTLFVTLLCSFLFSMNLKLSDIIRVRTNKLSDKILSESLIVRNFSILMYMKMKM